MKRWTGTAAEKEAAVLDLVVACLTNDDIAEELGVSEATVKHWVSRLLEKYGANDRMALALKVVALGLVPPPLDTGSKPVPGSGATSTR